MTLRSMLGVSVKASLVSLSQVPFFVLSAPFTVRASASRVLAFRSLRRSPRTFTLYSLDLRKATYFSSPQSAISMTSRKQEDASCEIAMSPIAVNLEAVLKRVAEVTSEHGRNGPLPRLVAVSKTKPVGDLLSAYESGQRIFGENYRHIKRQFFPNMDYAVGGKIIDHFIDDSSFVQELIEKSPQMPEDVIWHFIGHLQSNKAKALITGVPNLQVLETLDTTKLADKLQVACEAASREKPLGVFIQIDTSGEEAKSGIPHDDLNACLALARHLAESCPSLALKGVMTIGAPDDISCFDKLAVCRDALAQGISVEPQSLQLSMGMSGDFEEAIRRGSTNVRVGSTIFGARNYPNKKS